MERRMQKKNSKSINKASWDGKIEGERKKDYKDL